MGQKINPISLRLHNTNRHFENCWYSNYFYKDLLLKDLFLQRYFNNFLKLLKLPSGRFSIQHLQKQTQISNFLCYSKPTREWRSTIFGLTKKKKNRYFFKNRTGFKKRNKKITKLTCFFNNLNQAKLHKIQKKITSFQNFQLWSALLKTKQKNLLTSRLFFESTSQKLDLDFFPFNEFFKSPKLLEKINPVSVHQVENSNLLFFQNLFIYKSLKFYLKKKNLLDKQEFLSLIPDSFLFDKKKKKEKIKGKSKKKSIDKFNTTLQVLPNFTVLDLKYKNYLESFLSSLYKYQIDYNPFKVKNDWQHASYLADEIVYFLERRIPFRRLKTKLLKQLAKISAIRGIRITCSGRVGGKSKKAQRAKMECIKYGQTSLQVFSSPIDFSMKTARTSFGSVGVKVWICYNEIM